MDKTSDDVIRAILKRGNDVQIQRKGEGYVILEVRRVIRASYTEPQNDGGEIAICNHS